MRIVFRKTRSMLLVGLSPLLLACGDTVAPPNELVGNYTAVTFLTTGTSGQRNELLSGSTLVLNLNANGSTSGHLHIAPSTGNPAFDADMAGTWSQNGMTVDIAQGADTFVRDMPFALTPGPTANWDLVGDETFSGGRIQVTLRKS